MVDRRSSLRAIGSLLVAVVFFAVACGGSEPETTTQTPEKPAAKAAPSPIDGLFFNGHSVLSVERGKWSLQAQTIRLDGVIEVSDGRLVISKESSCSDAGSYAWTLEVETLSLRAEHDPCPGRDVIFSGQWEPIAAVGDRAKIGQNVVLPDLHFALFRGQRDVSAEQSAEIEVMIREGKGWFFSPTVLTGAPGQELELTIRNPRGPGIVPFAHNFSLPDQEIDLDVPSGEQAKVTVAFPASGSLTFLCKYHADHGQAGALIVAG